jgi:Holliday junction resolvase RusA-like endonuclease
MIVIDVFGEPAPQGSKRHVGRGIMVESSAKVKPWREAVTFAAAQAAAKGFRQVGPVGVTIMFYVRRPPSAPKSRRYPDRKPDLDKLIRSTLDALVIGGVIEDDARIIAIRAGKVYAKTRPTGALIEINSLVEIEEVADAAGAQHQARVF